MISRIALLAGLALVAAVPAAASAPAGAVQELAALGRAAGGEHWQGIAAIVADGSESVDGLKCRVHSVTDLRDGRASVAIRCPVFDTGWGIDARGAWRRDRTGWVHSLDSPEAVKLAVTDRWLNRNGPYFPGRLPAVSKSLPATTVHGVTYRRIDVTPAKGRTVTLWIGGRHDQIARTVMRRSFQFQTVQYGDYREVQGVMLPFRIVSSLGAHAQPQVETIARYRLLTSVPGRSLERPANRANDVQIPAGGTRIPLVVSPSGKFLVEAKIDGQGPFPFVLDTGGHDILTPAAASALGLALSGHGVSYGAGAGSTPLRYARVKSIALGKAHLDDQSVLVMAMSPILTDRGDKPPIAGILGLGVLERFAVTIDPADKTLTLQPFRAFEPPAGAVALPIRFTDDMPLVRAALDGKNGLFGMDTGNSGPLMLFPTWAAKNGLTRYYEAGLPIPEGGVGGMFMAHMALIHSLALGGLAVPGKQLGVLTPHGVGATSNPSEAGNLGTTVWRAFRFTLDYRNQYVYLVPRPHYTPPFPTATGGFRAVKFAPQAFTVIEVTPNGPAAKVGLRKGEQIVAVDGVKAADLASLYLMTHIAASKPGTRLRLTRTDGSTVTVVLTPNTAMLKALRPEVQ